MSCSRTWSRTWHAELFSIASLTGVYPGDDALEDAFEISPSGLKLARDVLREYGNMSAATVLFVLERALAQHPSGVGLVGALGPGFSAGFVVMDDI